MAPVERPSRLPAGVKAFVLVARFSCIRVHCNSRLHRNRSVDRAHFEGVAACGEVERSLRISVWAVAAALKRLLADAEPLSENVSLDTRANRADIRRGIGCALRTAGFRSPG